MGLVHGGQSPDKIVLVAVEQWVKCFKEKEGSH